MAEKRIDQLREILAKAAARDEVLLNALETFAVDLLKDLGEDDKPPVWAEIKAARGEHQVNPHLLMQDGWLRGDLVVEVAPDAKFVIGLRMSTTRDGTHDVGLVKEMSHSAIIDPPDEKDRAGARTKLFERIFACLELDVRRSVAFPAG
jgi:hypothetical protein